MWESLGERCVVGQVGQDEGAFRTLYDATSREVLAYCRRRCDDDAAAQDAAADTYVVAWRRWEDVPASPDEAQLWLFAVARRVLSNQRRGRLRQRRLAVKVAALGTRRRPSTEERVAAREDHRVVLRALSTLSDGDQEVLRLAAWEGLDGDAIARVLGCSRDAGYVRLHRARRRLADACGVTTVTAHRLGHDVPGGGVR